MAIIIIINNTLIVIITVTVVIIINYYYNNYYYINYNNNNNNNNLPRSIELDQSSFGSQGQVEVLSSQGSDRRRSDFQFSVGADLVVDPTDDGVGGSAAIVILRLGGSLGEKLDGWESCDSVLLS